VDEASSFRLLWFAYGPQPVTVIVISYVVAGRFAPGNNAADFIRWLFGAKRLTTSKFT